MALDCVNASFQHLTIAAPNISVPPATFSVWIKTTSIVAANSALFHWRSGIDTGLILRFISSNWHLRYYVDDGPEWIVNTGHTLSTGIWQHACLSLAATQARVYLGGVGFTNNVTHSTANLNDTGYLGRDPFPDANHTTFNGALAEPAIWNVALNDAECLALSKGISPLALANRLPNLVMYHDFIRDAVRGFGTTLTPVNAPAAAPHPPLRCRASRMRYEIPRANFQSPFRPAHSSVQAGRVLEGSAQVIGTSAGLSLPNGEVSS
jgi:hypothetical protein